MLTKITHHIDLTQAANEIREAVLDTWADKAESPFLFLIGAGVSWPNVPLARDMVEHCRGKAKKKRSSRDPATQDEYTVFHHWLNRAYPQLGQRRRYLASLAQDAAISEASFRLAQLLLGEDDNIAVTDLVISANFDDALSRALALFGKEHIVCDHPLSAGRIDLEDPRLKLIQAFGAYPHYDGARQANQSVSDAPDSMLDGLIADAFRLRSPLVVGYSGWEQDAIMRNLQKRLSGPPLTNNLYWFCHDSEDLESLPDWLRSHPNVRTVTASADAVGTNPAEPGDLDEESSDDEREGLLTASTIFRVLSEVFDLDMPELARNPFEHLAKRIRSALGADMPHDPFGLQNALAQLEGKQAAPAPAHPVTVTPIRKAAAADLPLSDPKDDSDDMDDSPTEIPWPSAALPPDLEGLDEAVRNGDYEAAFAIGLTLSPDALQLSEKERLADLYFKIAMSTGDKSPDKLKALNAIIELGGKDKPANPRLRLSASKAYLHKGMTLAELDCPDEEIATYDEAIAQLGVLNFPVLKEQLARILLNKASRLFALQRSEEGSAAVDELAKRFGRTDDAGARESVAAGLITKANYLCREGHIDDAVRVYQHTAIHFKGIRLPAALPELSEALSRAGIPENVNQNSLNLELAEKPRATSAQTADSAQKSTASVQSGVPADGTLRTIYGQSYRVVNDEERPGMAHQVAVAANNKGWELLLHAKEQWIKGNEEGARNSLSAAYQAIKVSLNRRPDHPPTLANLAYIQFLNNQRDAARNTLAKALSLSGESLRSVILHDIKYHPLPHDQAYKTLVDSIRPASSGRSAT